MSHWLEAFQLDGKSCALIPLDTTHLNDLISAASDDELWKIRYAQVPSPESMEAEINRRLALKTKGLMLPFTVIDARTNKMVGMTCYTQVDEDNKRLGIGWTWYAKQAQRTAINTECKYLLLKHAFENLGCIAVEFKVDTFNIKSQNAVLRIGAKLDGTIRNHSKLNDGHVRDMHSYSILPNEWPNVKAHLEWLMR
ncbi:MAG: GNAT family N-acetyltransferase [Gammaproteobacteria bacterium]|nr:GNAT family N-acetyltransferase [Gammaproteobacteria bacterium]